MGCTKCDIEKNIRQNKKNIENPKLHARIIHSRIENLSKKTKIPKKEENTDSYNDCLSNLEVKGVSKETAVKLCNAMNKSHNTKKKSALVQNEDVSKMTKEQILAEYEKTFNQINMLKLEPTPNLMQHENVRSKVNNLDSKLWDLKWEYEKKATDDTWEDDLLQVRIRARNNNLSIVQNEKNRPSLLSLTAGKSKEEQIRLSNLHYPEYSDDFLNEVF